MKKNVGSIDRTLRLVLGLVIIAVGLYYQSWWGLIGIVPLLTSAFSRCPVYLPFGISTCKTETK
jgi:hypothetical protein